MPSPTIKNNKDYMRIFQYAAQMLMIAISGIIAFYLAIVDKPDYYNLIWILPFSFMLMMATVIFTNKILFRSISFTIIVGIYFFRVVLMPLVLVFGNFHSLVRNKDVFQKMPLVLLLMSYEIIIVFMFLHILIRKTFTHNMAFVDSNINFSKRNLCFYFIIMFLTIFWIYMFIRYPIVRGDFSTLMTKGLKKANIVLISRKMSSTDVLNGVPGILYNFFIYDFRILKMFLPIVIIQFIHTKIKNGKKVALLIALVLVLIIMLFTNDEKLNSLQFALALIIVIYQLYPKQLKQLIVPLLCSFVVLVMYGLLSKTDTLSSTDPLKELSLTLNAYFGGTQNVAVAVSMPNENRWYYMYADLVTSIPYFSIFFRHITVTSGTIFNETLYGRLGAPVNQIVPAIGMGYYYFGFLLAPIVPCILIWLSVKFEKTALKLHDVLYKYIFYYLSIAFAISPVVQNWDLMYPLVFFGGIGIFIPWLSRCMINNGKFIIYKKNRYLQ